MPVWVEPRRSGNRRRWLVRWQYPGTKERGSVVVYSPKQAEELSSKKRLELQGQRLGLAPVTGALRLGAFVEAALERAKTQHAQNTYEHFDQPALKGFLAFAGDRPLPAVTPALVDRWRVHLAEKEGYGPSSIAAYLRHLRAAFGRAVKLGLLGANPCAGVVLPVGPAAGRLLSDEELAQLMPALPPHVRRVAVVALHQGLRISEAAALDWRWLRPAEGGGLVLHLPGPATKTGQARSMLVHPAAVAALGPVRAAGPVFEGRWPGRPLQRDVLESGLRAATRRLKMGRVRWHDFRHTWATRYMEKYGDLFGLMQAGGWRSLRAVRVYQHYSRVREERVLGLDFGAVSHASPTVFPLGPIPTRCAGRQKAHKNKAH